MRKIILVVHTTLDGYVSNKDGELEGFTQSPENLDFVCRLTDSADALIVGRNSYEMLNGYWPQAGNNPEATDSEKKYSSWYNNAQKIVLSKSLSNKGLNKTIILSKNILEKISEIKKMEGKDILLFGSPTAFQTLAELNLIDEYWVIIYPVIFGKGIPFFTRLNFSNELKFLSSTQFSKGEIAIHYKVEN